MGNRKNSIVVDVTRMVCAVLIICAGLLWCGTHVFGQEQSFTKTEAWDGAGAGGKRITTETKNEGGESTIETRLLDPKGTLRSRLLETKKATGETTKESEVYDENGTLEIMFWEEKNSSGKPTLVRSEYYNNGVLKRGFIHEYDETGKVKRYRVYNPALESYEEKELPKAEDSSSFPQTALGDYPQTVKKDNNGPKGVQSSESNPQPRKDEKGPPAAKVNETKGTIDSCLVGTWRSESIVGPSGQRGGSGIVMTIKPDGTITINYDKMQSLEAEKGNAGPVRYDNWWRGTAAGHITTNGGTATIVSVEKSDVSRKSTAQGRTTTNPLGKLGPAVPTGFTCDQTTLKWTSAGNAFTFKREEKAR